MKILIPDYMSPIKEDAGEVLLAARLYHEALPFLEARWMKDPKNARANVALGLCIFYHDQFEEAEAMLRFVTENFPDEAMGWHALGNLVEGLGKFDEALRCYQKSVALRPDVPACNYGVASNLMRQSRFEEAWPYWERGRNLLSVDTVPIWEGEDLKDKKLLVIREGGMGDVIWIMRYLPLLQKMGAKVILYSYTGLRGLLAKHPWCDMYVDSDEIIETTEFDYQISLLSIMAILKKCPLGMEKPYFRSPHPAPRNGRKRVGINWVAGENGGVVRKIRGIPVEEMEPFRELDAEFVNLQIEEEPPKWMADNRGAIKGWHKTADMLASCDVVVTADTCLLHLAGAMGVPTIGLLPLNFEFKWTFTKEWYPTVEPVFSTNPISFSPAVEKAVPMVKEMLCSK